MACSKMSGLGMTLQPPPPLTEPQIDSDNDHHHTLTELAETDNHFQEIQVDFKNAGMKVIQVEMLKNNHLWKRYASERDLILEQREKTDTDFKLNERYLYHGTSAKKSYICDEGLDSRMSNEGCFGKGIYFSDYPKKCIKYATRKDKGEDSYILLVRVILGVPKVFPRGKKARALKREPEKEEPYTGHRFYDSVEGCPVNHKEFVVYESRRALVEGIITFSVEKKEKKKAEPEAEPVGADGLNNLDDASDSDNQDNTGDALTDLSSSDSDGEDDKEKEIDKSLSDSTHSSDTEDSSSSDEASSKGLKTDDEIEQLVIQKKRQFGDATGETDELEIERYLIRSNMSVEAAIKLYEEKKAQGFPESEDEEIEDPFPQDHPLPNSEGWNKLSKEDQQAFIEGQVDDFLCVTGLDVDERDFAKKCLSAVNMNLDHAILAYYEDIL